MELVLAGANAVGVGTGFFFDPRLVDRLRDLERWLDRRSPRSPRWWGMSRVIPADRARFDRLVDEVLETLPEAIVELFDEKPLVVEDRPSLEILREFGLDEAQSDEICGLHSGPMGRVPHLDGATDGDPIDEIGVIHLFREGVVACAGWSRGSMPSRTAPRSRVGEDLVQGDRGHILHEVGHHFGLDEDDLDRLGYA